MTKCAPVALFVCNRPEHTRRTVEALAANREASATELFVFSDAAKSAAAAAAVNEVRAYVRGITGFARVSLIERETNLGLARSIIEGVSRLCEDYGRVIVLEDDLVTSPHFLAFMNRALDLWQDEARIMSVCGYMYPVDLPEGDQSFLLPVAHSWGWATWRDRWAEFDADGAGLLARLRTSGRMDQFDAFGPHSYTKMLTDQIAGRNDSWFIRWLASGFLAGKLSLYPRQSLVRNIGIDGSGVHCAEWRIDPFAVEPAQNALSVDRIRVAAHSSNMAKLARYFWRIRLARVVNFAYRILRFR
ncbi:MAG: glycosyltransferase [Rhodocyclales bacterium]|nr:glycosyltransferase [Rhodocyclales bacterium]